MASHWHTEPSMPSAGRKSLIRAMHALRAMHLNLSFLLGSWANVLTRILTHTKGASVIFSLIDSLSVCTPRDSQHSYSPGDSRLGSRRGVDSGVAGGVTVATLRGAQLVRVGQRGHANNFEQRAASRTRICRHGRSRWPASRAQKHPAHGWPSMRV